MRSMTRQGMAWALGLGLTSMGGALHAASLGDIRGQVTLGQRLSVLVSADPDGSGQLADACLRADVYDGDSRLPADAVRVKAVHDATRRPVIRVRSQVPVREPWVTVQVSMGCAQPVSRQYVLMADAPAPTQGLQPREDRPTVARRPQVDELTPLPTRAPNRPTPRLLVDPLSTDALVEPVLQLDTQLRALPADADASQVPEPVQARRMAARAYWWALQASPQEANQMQGRLQDLERQIDELMHWQPPAPDAAAEGKPPPRITSSKQLPVDESEVAQVRLVGLLCVAAFAALAWGYRAWLARTDARLPEAAQPLWAPPGGWPTAGR